jgi:hypothetical protein
MLMATIVGGFTFGLAQCSAGQERLPYVPSYPSLSVSPLGGTLSPWLNLGRQDPGPLGPYLSYVRPNLQLERTLTEQREQIQQQQQNLQRLRGWATQVERRGSVSPTGIGGHFMDTSHYYPLRPQ